MGNREITLQKMQCGTCKTVLACAFDRRRKPMVCPLCNHLGPLVYIPPGDAKEGPPVHELPVAKYPGMGRTLLPKLLSPILAFVLGFFACVLLYALDWGKPLDRVARRIVVAIGEEFSGKAPAKNTDRGTPELF